MFKKKNNNVNDDKALLLECMDKAISGDFSYIDESIFSDPELGARYNKVLRAFMESNNSFVMTLNDSMVHVGDNSCVKQMIEQLNSQTSAINAMKSSSEEMDTSIDKIVSSVTSIQEGTHMAMESSSESVTNMQNSIHIVDESAKQIEMINEQIVTFQEKMDKITEIIDMVKRIAQKSGLLALNASIEAARAGEAGRGFAVVANQIKDLSANTTQSSDDVVKYVTEIQDGITALVEAVDSTTKQLKLSTHAVHSSVAEINNVNEQINTISLAMDAISNEIQNQSALTQNFVDSVDSIADNYDTLYNECVATGSHLYKIGRYVDNARNKLAKANSDLTVLDRLAIFKMDHLTFTWRVYNNLSDFEHLLITQLNNPKGCKLGKYMATITDTRITNSAAFKKVMTEHDAVHKHACDSWYAKEDGDRETAMHHFNLTFEAYERFANAIDQLADVYRANGETAQTTVM